MKRQGYAITSFFICITVFIWPVISSANSAGSVDNNQKLFDQNNNLPLWWNISLGMDDVLLPGFSPITVNNATVMLGAGRGYKWEKSYFPVSFTANNTPIAGPYNLVLNIGNRESVLTADTVEIKKSSPTHVVVITKGHFSDSLLIRVESQIEYDGVVMSTLELVPVKPITIDGLDAVVNIVRTPSLKMLAFKADTIRQRVKRIVYPTRYKGDFLNAIGFADGNRSFWWFADNAKGWIWNASTVTEVTEDAQTIKLRQRLIGSHYEVKTKCVFKFNYLVTPVKELNGEWRKNRVARHATEEESKYNKYQIWWTNAFAHQDLPYTEYPDHVKQQIPQNDLKNYQGLSKNRELIQQYRTFGMERLPYFSAHVLSALDPALKEYRDLWEVEPPYIIPPSSDKPYTAKISKPWLTHRAKGYSDYLLYRFDKLIDELDFSGLYFDQGGVIQSLNSQNGAWKDSNGKIHASTDILALRKFFKRLSVLFYLKKKPGIIYVHNSMVPVIPAYSFVTSMVQGEEFIDSLKNIDYLSSVSFNDIRTQYTTDQYGIVNTLLSELWSPRVKDGKSPWDNKKTWLHSPRYLKAFRNLMALCFLHDIPVITLAPIPDIKSAYQPFDNFGYEKAKFVGYWNNKLNVNDSQQYYVSFYKRKDKNDALLVIVNTGMNNGRTIIGNLENGLSLSGKKFKYRIYPEKEFSEVKNDNIEINISSKDYRLLEVKGS